MYRKVTCTCKVVILGDPCRGRYRDPRERLNGRKKNGEKSSSPCSLLFACYFPRPFKLSYALGLFKGSHEDVCQWTVVFILSVLNWGYIISRQSWKSEGNVCTIELIYLKPSRSPGHPKGSPVPKYWSNNFLWGSVMPRIRIVRSFKLDCIISVIKEITRKH